MDSRIEYGYDEGRESVYLIPHPVIARLDRVIHGEICRLEIWLYG